MIVYSATRKQFTADVVSNQIEQRILDAYRLRLGRSTSPNEIMAWKNSMQYMNNVLVDGDIPTTPAWPSSTRSPRPPSGSTSS